MEEAYLSDKASVTTAEFPLGVEGDTKVPGRVVLADGGWLGKMAAMIILLEDIFLLVAAQVLDKGERLLRLAKAFVSTLSRAGVVTGTGLVLPKLVSSMATELLREGAHVSCEGVGVTLVIGGTVMLMKLDKQLRVSSNCPEFVLGGTVSRTKLDTLSGKSSRVFFNCSC